MFGRLQPFNALKLIWSVKNFKVGFCITNFGANPRELVCYFLSTPNDSIFLVTCRDIYILLMSNIIHVFLQVESIVLSIISMLSSPNDESPANVEAAVSLPFFFFIHRCVQMTLPSHILWALLMFASYIYILPFVFDVLLEDKAN